MNKRKKRLIHCGVVILLVSLGVVGMRALTESKPEMQKREPAVPTPLVRAIKVSTGPRSVTIRGEGTVRPLREISLIPQVDGEVIYISPNLVNGGTVDKGDTLLRIDPADYEVAVTLAQATVKDAESQLQLAKEEASASQEEWRLLHAGDDQSHTAPPPLVAKEPQLAAAEAKLDAERANLRKALLNLERTELKAPFNGRISQENIDIGQHVARGQTLATLYSVEVAEIVLPLEDEDLFWFHAPGFTPGNTPGSTAKVRARVAGQERAWAGKVVRTEGILDERTRMINVVVRVERPYATKPPLPVGLFVTVDITGHSLPNAALIPRSAVHDTNLVWVVGKDGRLRFRQIDVARLQDDRALIRSGLNNGEIIVITPLKAVTDGMTVRVQVIEEGDRS